MLYLSVAKCEPHAAVSSLCDVVHTRRHQSVLAVQMSCLSTIHVVHRQSTFRTDKHIVGALVPVEGGDESVQRLLIHGYAGLACNPVQPRFCCHPYVALSVDGQRHDKVVRQSVSRTDMICIADYLGAGSDAPDHAAGEKHPSLNHIILNMFVFCYYGVTKIHIIYYIAFFLLKFFSLRRKSVCRLTLFHPQPEISSTIQHLLTAQCFGHNKPLQPFEGNKKRNLQKIVI